MAKLSAEELLKKALAARGLAISGITAEGLYVVERDETKCTISLDNAIKEYRRDSDASVFERLAANVAALFENELLLPDWKTAKAGIRFVAEPSDYDLNDVVHDGVTDTVSRVIEYLNPEETGLAWVPRDQLKQWSVSKADLLKVAAQNMADLMESVTIELSEVHGHQFGMLVTRFIPLKASLMFSPNFGEKVKPLLGWPVHVIAPARDFVYVVPEKDADLLNRMGEVAFREYEESAYPLTLEVLRVSDNGIEAIGTFGEPPP